MTTILATYYAKIQDVPDSEYKGVNTGFLYSAKD